MTDINGKPLRVGDRVRFVAHDSTWLVGVVRAVKETSYYNNFEQRLDIWEAKVDDGDPDNAAWVESDRVEVLS